jgi:probable phosphoglycerate mutase
VTPERILLVRHGETDWNREGRLQGWGPTPLNDRGREQARRVGEALATEYDIDRIVASDSFRTRETTEHIRDAGIEPEPTFDPGWRERGLGVYQGFTREELNDRFPAFAMDAGALSLQEEPEGGETVAGVYERVVDAWDDLTRTADGETVLVVTHGGPIRVVLSHLNGADILTAIREYDVGNCGLTEIADLEVVRQSERVFDPVPSR